MKQLIIAEKSSVGQSIAKVLGITNKENGYMEGDNYICSWASGHLVTLSKPSKYDEKFKKWNLEDLPIIPNNFKTEIINSSSKQYNVLKNLIKRDDVDSLICATDAGREGELIFRLIYDKVGVLKPFKRLWISSMEDESIKKGLDNLKDGKDYDNLYEAALCRQRADWLVGLNLTRLITIKNNKLLPVGRVQTPTLKLIVDRDYEIEHFIKDKYYVVEIDLEKFKMTSSRIDKEEEAKKLLDLIPGEITIESVEEKTKVTKPSKPYDLTTLQREANKIYNLSAKNTLKIVQDLYEQKYVTYPRTDSRYLNEDMQLSINDLLTIIDFDFSIDSYNFKSIFNNKKVSDHHAIIPTVTGIKCDKSNFDENHLKIFNMIVKKLVASVSDNLIENLTKVKTTINGYEFTQNSKVTVQKGFKEIYQLKDDNTNNAYSMDQISEGDIFKINNSKINEKYTNPEARYTEDTLLNAMENAGKDLLDPNIEIEREGLGTTATRADIIEKLIKDQYISRNKKQLISTDLGRKLIEIAPDLIKDSKLTVDWENEFSEIANGKVEASEFMFDLTNTIKNIVNSYNIENTFEKTEKTNTKSEKFGKCPYCDGDVFLSEKSLFCENSKYGKNKGNCKFAIFRTISNHKLTENECKDLLENGKTDEITDFKSDKTKKKFPAKIKLNPANEKYITTLEFTKVNR